MVADEGQNKKERRNESSKRRGRRSRRRRGQLVLHVQSVNPARACGGFLHNTSWEKNIVEKEEGKTEKQEEQEEQEEHEEEPEEEPEEKEKEEEEGGATHSCSRSKLFNQALAWVRRMSASPASDGRRWC